MEQHENTQWIDRLTWIGSNGSDADDTDAAVILCQRTSMKQRDRSFGAINQGVCTKKYKSCSIPVELCVLYVCIYM